MGPAVNRHGPHHPGNGAECPQLERIDPSGRYSELERHGFRSSCSPYRYSAPQSLETPIRLSLLTFAAAILSLLPASVAGAQSSHGSIGVGATILPAPAAPLASRVTMDVDASGNGILRVATSPTADRVSATTFLRVSRGDSADGRRVFVAQKGAQGAETILLLPDTASDTGLRLERLIVAGT